ncbi:Protein N-acetyltransferase, RimJ/RimL family [Marinitoga hydrogenitolerans DSM 16785]|uniref:Protein N-acetyltransferase, RimJ/RimL family n=1 Tax=Marinitoga hydrogenitolerans (strain DSM 16785 / JCM 12826 / AT1271) TaxID=1122195 RepID=A0A1M4ZFC8_MARH1|nr:GNAT family protein [Marinitoga hydrogenitolerans]SHF16764.1 Protein N-acetyltransferase, RimJ/RimL family [Marinitoga hydrogenitolerans DSM 16785]
MITIYKNYYGDLFFKLKNNTEFREILDLIKKIPKRYIYFFSEVKNEYYYMNNIGELYILKGKKESNILKTFSNFYPENDLIYSILKLTNKFLIPFTVFDLANFYKKGYKIRYLKQNEKVISLYILKNNIVEFVFFDVENINLMIQTLNDIASFVEDEYIINVYSNQQNFKNFLLNKNFLAEKEFFIHRLDGYGIHITTPEKNDSNNMMEFYENVLKNTSTLATQLDEFDKTKKDIEKIIDISKKLFGIRILIAKYEKKIIGNCDIYWNIQRKRLERTAKLGISVLENFRNIGIGTMLINNHIVWCIENPKIHRLELEVFSNNPKAISLYEKLGFTIEGKRKEAAFINYKYYDILFMGYITEPKNLF